jgi:hypothetical protein
LMGRYDGNVIQATGKDWFLDRDCILALGRA